MITTQNYGATTGANAAYWRATFAAEKLHQKKPVEPPESANPDLDAIHANPKMTRDEKLAAARAILAAANEQPAAAAEPATIESKAADTKSKVCIIANHISKQGMSRSAAFARSWAVVKAQEIELKAAGVTFGRRQEALERLTHYEQERISLEMKREPENANDPNAIAVTVTVAGKGSYQIGYIPAVLAKFIAPLLDSGKAVSATFREIRGKYESWHNYGLALAVSI